MATTANENNDQNTLSVGVLLIFGDIISNQQRDEIFNYLNKALKLIDSKKFHEIDNLFNNLINIEEFQAESQYRQIKITDNGSIAGFLYLPNFHAVLNVLKDYFNSCSHVSIIFCGQQIDSHGSLILADSTFTSDHLNNLFEDGGKYLTEDLQIILPFISHQWTKLLKQKCVKNIHIDDLSKEINNENSFGNEFYQRLNQVLYKDSIDFDIYHKLISRDSSGTIAFDEPNLYILYGQQGEASLFGIRGFVVLINGGFSRMPSYWNLIRGLQTVDACILTHFDYSVLSGLQTIIHRKTIPSLHDGRLCKPDIGAMFLNNIQRTRLQALHSLKAPSNSKLSVNLSHNIDQFLNDIKQLNIETFDLVKNTTPNKHTIEPINLYKKIAFGSLDLYVLYPLSSSSMDDDKSLATLQKIPIRDQQPSPSIIPHHHWYSSCALLVWTPTAKSSKDSLVRILYTGACPQTLVFEALARARHLEFLHESQQQLQTSRASTPKTTSSTASSINVKYSISKLKSTSSTSSSSEKIKVLPRTVTSQSKLRLVPTTTTTKLDRKTSIPRTDPPLQSANKDKKIFNSRQTISKTITKVNQVDRHGRNLQTQNIEQSNNEIKRPESISFTNNINEAFVDSNTATPLDENNSYFIATDPMTTSFVDGAPNTRNPFLDKNDDIEIIHHNISTATTSSIDEINPQGLPMNDENNTKRLTVRKSSLPTISNNNPRKTKQNLPSGSIFYVDVAFIPYHGNEHYVDSEFFRRIRARYYVLNAVEINRLTLESLIDGKQQWDKQEQIPVTLVPTYDGDQLRQFFVMNKNRLAELNINIIPASTRCNVQYDDEGSPAQRLRFSNDQ
ncbi:unnamed protein product [Rotaria socialis]|uniref:Microtubule-associated protein 1A/B/S-like MBL-like domain-containing protein n=1 Tax=Rotaria socialis TaxID=392032 RepID=A0A820E3Y7_9BILA|nr:unnamed protein product [Rotaria socialis]CAF4241088.1 unnamed protein product [Rotaria socialis]